MIGAASGWGATIRTCEDGPLFLKERGCLPESFDWEMLYPFTTFKEKQIPLPDSLPLVADFNRRLSERVAAALQSHYFPVVIGGDHSNAIGTWNGVAKACKEPFGLIWIDAHMDAHTLETTPSNAWHGMPLASLMGYGTSELATLTRSQPILLPEHLCLIGTRSFEEGEAALLQRLGVKIYYIEEVKERGLSNVLSEAIAYINTGTNGFGVSIDVDVVDPSEAPGTGCFEPNGLSAQMLLSALSLIRTDERLKAFELVEFNPHKDANHITLQLCREILGAALR
jgi:arginase